MSKTYLDMFDKIVKHVWLSNTFSDWDEETWLIKEDINDILQEVLTISKSYLKKAWISIPWWTVWWQRNYTIPDTVDKITTVKITTWWEDYYPKEITIGDFHKLDEDADSDIPVFFTIDKGELYIYPTPSTSSLPIEVNANQYATQLNTKANSSTDNTTELDIKQWYENIIYYYWLSEAYLRLEEVWLADRYDIKHEKLMKKYRQEVNNPTNNPVVKYWESGIINPNNYPLITE